MLFILLSHVKKIDERGFKTREMGKGNALNRTMADCDAVSPQCTISTLKWNAPCGMLLFVWTSHHGTERKGKGGRGQVPCIWNDKA